MYKTIAEIDAIRAKTREDLMIRLDPKAQPTAEGGRMHIMVCCRYRLYIIKLNPDY